MMFFNACVQTRLKMMSFASGSSIRSTIRNLKGSTMNKAVVTGLAIFLGLAAGQEISAQDLIVTNARVIVGNGQVIPNGSVAVRRGRIAAVAEGSPTDPDLPVVDASGLSVMPGFIDAHRQVIHGDPGEWMEDAAEHMQAYLEAGFTTVLSAGDPTEPILELRDRIDSREITGPRLLVSGPVVLDLSDSGDAAEAAVREAVLEMTLTAADAIAADMRAAPGQHNTWLLAVARDEADRQGLVTLTLVRDVEDVMEAVAGGSGYLTGTPQSGPLDEEAARRIVHVGRDNAEYGLVMTSTLGTFVPAFADRNAYVAASLEDDNLPRLGDLTPYPLEALSGALQGVANARMLWDAGIIYGFGTATLFPPADALRHELIPLRLAFSNRDIVRMLTRSGAFAVRRDDALGTLELGKIADLVIVDGNPLTDLDALFRIVAVIRTGQMVVDNR